MTTQKTRSNSLSTGFLMFDSSNFGDFGVPRMKRKGSVVVLEPWRYFILRNNRKAVSSKGFDTYEQARQALRKVLRTKFTGKAVRGDGGFDNPFGGRWTTNPCGMGHLGYTIEKR